MVERNDSMLAVMVIQKGVCCLESDLSRKEFARWTINQWTGPVKT